MPKEVDTRLKKYIDAIRFRVFEEPHRSIFPEIGDLGRRVFALQRYLGALKDPKRGAAWIREQTAMTEDEYVEWQDSPDFALQSRELTSIRSRFRTANPEHRLVAGSRFRSLDAQIKNWNRNGTVGTHAPKVLARAQRELKDAATYPDLGPYLNEKSGLLVHSALPAGVSVVAGIGNIAGGPLAAMAAAGIALGAAAYGNTLARNAAIDRFIEWLAKQTTGKPSVTVATPGLSNHGVGQAIDFQVHKGSVKLAGASNPDHWRTSGWADRLADAVRPSAYFSGPLRVPDEPWHWTFDPTP